MYIIILAILAILNLKYFTLTISSPLLIFPCYDGKCKVPFILACFQQEHHLASDFQCQLIISFFIFN